MKKKLFLLLRGRNLFALSALLLLILIPSVITAETHFSDDADAVEESADSVFMLEIYSSSRQRIAIGSGFIAFNSSTLITNYHVIEGGAYVIAISDDQDKYLITDFCILDQKKDIAILHFEQETNAKPLPLDTDNDYKRAQTVVAIGSPAGLKNTISIGNISGFYTKDGKNWIQFTAPISSGSSGGALFNDEGEIIGVTTATYASAQNVNMAIRIDEVISLYRKWNHETTYRIGNVQGQIYPQITSAASSSEETTVWITAGGKKYHNNPNCSKMRAPLEINLLDAIERGYEPCGKCYK